MNPRPRANHRSTTAQRAGACALLCAVAITGWACSQPSNGASPEPKIRKAAATNRQDNRTAWQGVSSCSAQACHGDIAIDQVYGIWGNEYTLWVENDPHAKAHRVLYDERSVRMAQLLKDRLKGAPAHEARECLACHAPQADLAHGQNERGFASDGVGCENCHANGKSSAWINEHATVSWSTLSPEEKHERGFTNTKNIYERADRCVKCHVGAEDRDVDHDLIAAGHPRLAFELSTFTATLPKHWDEKRQLELDPTREARSWTVGQAVSGRAALSLVADRAENKDKAWPEFSEFSCYACHHQLKNAEWRRQPAGENEMAAVAWGSWYLRSAQSLAAQSQNLLNVPGPHKQIDSMFKLMSGDVYGNRDRGEVVTTARKSAADLDAWARQLNRREIYTPLAVRDLLAHIAADQALPTDWDGATQTYLAMVALHPQGKASDPARAPDIQPQLRQLYDGLKFRTRFDSPSHYQHDEFLNVLEAIRSRYPVAEELRR